MSASSSDDEGPARVNTPKRKRLQARGSSPINERKALRKNRRHRIDYSVIEGNIPIASAVTEPIASAGDSQGDQPGGSEAQSGGRQRAPKIVAVVDPADAFAEACKHLAPAFAEDYFLGHGHAKLNRSLAMNATSAAPEAADIAGGQIPHPEQFRSWMQLLRVGYSVLVEGVGSKRQLLREFVDQALKPAGLQIVQMNAFDARFSFCECLRGLLEKVQERRLQAWVKGGSGAQDYPNPARHGISADALAAAVRAAVATPGSRPLCLVVHSLENLPRHHLVALASLAGAPGIHLVASVDSIWASLAWDSRCLKDFKFCFKDVHTFAGYEVEATARHPRGLPPWSGLGRDKRRTPKASLSLVMRSLTNNHRELVQAMAEEQLEENNTGISIPALLKVSTDRLIALTVPKLKGLLNELIDHEIVVQRGCASSVTNQALFVLPFDERTLEQLRDGKSLDSEEEGGGDGAPGDDGDEDIMV